MQIDLWVAIGLMWIAGIGGWWGGYVTGYWRAVRAYLEGMQS